MQTDSKKREPDEVKKMFGRVAPAYDIINHAMCGGLDILWRKRLVRAVTYKKCKCGISEGACKCKPAERKGAQDKTDARSFIDIACGSGDVTLALAKAAPDAAITGADFCAPMLEIARAKTAKTPFKITYLEADCEAMPFADNTFDGATISFGFRNFKNRQKCLAEIARILKPNGKLCILEVSRTGKFMEGAQNFFMGKIVPRIASLLGGTRADYEYLAKTTMEYPHPEEIKKMFLDCGFKNFHAKKMGCGLVAISCGEKMER